MGHKVFSLKEAVQNKYKEGNVKAKWTKVNREIIASGFKSSVIKRDHPRLNGFDYYFGYNSWEYPHYNSQLIWENYKLIKAPACAHAQLAKEKPQKTRKNHLVNST